MSGKHNEQSCVDCPSELGCVLHTCERTSHLRCILSNSFLVRPPSGEPLAKVLPMVTENANEDRPQLPGLCRVAVEGDGKTACCSRTITYGYQPRTRLVLVCTMLCTRIEATVCHSINVFSGNAFCHVVSQGQPTVNATATSSSNSCIPLPSVLAGHKIRARSTGKRTWTVDLCCMLLHSSCQRCCRHSTPALHAELPYSRSAAPTCRPWQLVSRNAANGSSIVMVRVRQDHSMRFRLI